MQVFYRNSQGCLRKTFEECSKNLRRTFEKSSKSVRKTFEEFEESSKNVRTTGSPPQGGRKHKFHKYCWLTLTIIAQRSWHERRRDKSAQLACAYGRMGPRAQMAQRNVCASSPGTLPLRPEWWCQAGRLRSKSWLHFRNTSKTSPRSWAKGAGQFPATLWHNSQAGPRTASNPSFL